MYSRDIDTEVTYVPINSVCKKITGELSYVRFLNEYGFREQV